jgi:hypothetical protein
MNLTLKISQLVITSIFSPVFLLQAVEPVFLLTASNKVGETWYHSEQIDTNLLETWLGMEFQLNSFVNGSATNTLESGTNVTKYRRWQYFMATNSIYGPMILYNSNGISVPMLKPEINKLNAYPDRFFLRAMGKELDRSRYGRDRPEPLRETMNYGKYYTAFSTTINLSKIFNVKTPGEYKLKVWPKIYQCDVTNNLVNERSWRAYECQCVQCSATNDDICERIDLEPVLIPIKWQILP